LLTVVETCRRHQQNVFSWLVEAVEARFAGKAAPSLLTVEPFLLRYTAHGYVYCAIQLSAAFVGFLLALQRSGVTMVSADFWKEAW
jgi:hypothetical protein